MFLKTESNKKKFAENYHEDFKFTEDQQISFTRTEIILMITIIISYII